MCTTKGILPEWKPSTGAPNTIRTAQQNVRVVASLSPMVRTSNPVMAASSLMVAASRPTKQTRRTSRPVRLSFAYFNSTDQ